MIKLAGNTVVPSWEAHHGFVGDLTEKHRRSIEKTAYEIFEKGSKSGTEEDWARAQIRVLGSVFRGEGNQK